VGRTNSTHGSRPSQFAVRNCTMHARSRCRVTPHQNRASSSRRGHGTASTTATGTTITTKAASGLITAVSWLTTTRATRAMQTSVRQRHGTNASCTHSERCGRILIS
jgi:hypothetical protein